MPKLHELTAAYAHLDALIDSEADDTTLFKTFEDIKDELAIKSENVAKLIENLETVADAMKASETRLAARRKAIENRAKSIRSYLLTNMVNSGISKIECEFFKLAVRDNPSAVIVDDEALIPSEYMRTPQPPPRAPDKKKILDDLKQGFVIEGVHIEQSKRLQIS